MISDLFLGSHILKSTKSVDMLISYSSGHIKNSILT